MPGRIAIVGAYTAAGFLIMPLLTLLHLAPCLQAFAELCPWMGVARGVLVTAAVDEPLRSFLRTAGFFGEPEFEL